MTNDQSSALHEVRTITPPRLSDVNLGPRFTCYRPVREDSPKMSVEKIGSKIVAHNYGHGGSGWTLAPGAVAYVNELLLNPKSGNDIKSDTPITVIGAGILGLFTAYNLLQRGYHAITVIAEAFEELTSHKAGAILAIFSLRNSPEMQRLINRIAIDSWKFYANIAKDAHPDLKNGTVVMPAYFESTAHSGHEIYVAHHLIPPPKNVLMDFGNGTTQRVVAFDQGIFIDVARITADLTNLLKVNKVAFIQHKINNFADIKDKVTINCCGLGAIELNADRKMTPVQGHMISLMNQEIQNQRYLLSTDPVSGKTKSGQTIDRSFYMMPKCPLGCAIQDTGVIGGTFVNDATEMTPNEEEFEFLIMRARNFYGVS